MIKPRLNWHAYFLSQEESNLWIKTAFIWLLSRFNLTLLLVPVFLWLLITVYDNYAIQFLKYALSFAHISLWSNWHLIYSIVHFNETTSTASHKNTFQFFKMASMTESNIIDSLRHISEQIDRCLASFIFIFGSVGSILNCLVLSKRILRSNPCALLLLISSIVDLISILIGLPSRILAGWNLDPTSTTSSICKIRAFVVFSTRTMAAWFVAIASIDRWLISSTHVHRRHMSNLKNMKRPACFIIVLSILSYIYMLECYEANILNAPLQCYGKTQRCCLATDLIYLFITILTPLALMITFGSLTVSNVRYALKRVHDGNLRLPNRSNESRRSKLKRFDRHLVRMLIIQILILTLLYIPQAIQKFRISLKPFGSTSKLEDSITVFLYNIEILLAFTANSMPFYVYILTGGKIFRQATLDLLRSFKRTIMGWFYLENI